MRLPLKNLLEWLADWDANMPNLAKYRSAKQLFVGKFHRSSCVN